MKNTVFIRRVRAKNYRSIAACDVELGSVSYLVGANGSGKGNFLDVLHFVKDALQGSLENALQVRGGLSEVRRRSGGHPTHFGIRLDFRLPDGRDGYYAFNVGARPASGFEVQREECAIGAPDVGPSFLMSGGVPEKTSEEVFPVSTPDRLALVNAAGLPTFRPVFDALVSVGFYNLNPRAIRKLQIPPVENIGVAPLLAGFTEGGAGRLRRDAAAAKVKLADLRQGGRLSCPFATG